MSRSEEYSDYSYEIKSIAERSNNSLIITNGGLLDKQGGWNIVIRDGVITAITPSPFDHSEYPNNECDVIDASYKLIIPGLVDAHVHLDKCYLLDRCCAARGDFTEAMNETLAAKSLFSVSDVRDRARRLIENEISFGTTLLRTHVEVDSIVGFVSLEAILELKKEYERMITIQIAVFAQEGITNRDGQVELMRKALHMGCDVVSSAPYCDPDPEENIRIAFQLASEFDCPLDFHLDYNLGDKPSYLQCVISETIRNNWQGRVVLGHMTYLSVHSLDVLTAIAAQLKDAGISVIALPASDLTMMARSDNGNKRRGVCPVSTLLDLGVTAAFATNNIQNLFTFSGDGDVLKAGTLLCQVLQLTSENGAFQCVSMATTVAAKALGLTHGLAVGCRADLVLVGGDSYCNMCESQPASQPTSSLSSTTTAPTHPSISSSLTIIPPTSPSQSSSFSPPFSPPPPFSPCLKLLSAPPFERIVLKNGKIVSHTLTKKSFFY